jgi:hypothetical protein
VVALTTGYLLEPLRGEARQSSRGPDNCD